MTAKKTDYLIIYCFISAFILSIAALARLFVVAELQMDDFSGLVAFVVTCLLLGSFYFSIQSIINEWLFPMVERIFRKKPPQIEPKPETEPIQLLETVTPQEETVVPQEETVAPQEETAVPNHEEYKLTAQQKIQQEQAQTLENVLTYTRQKLSLYVNEPDMEQLCQHIQFFQLATKEECDKIANPISVDSQLKTIDLRHFGWNIGNQFKKTGVERATFIKRVFAEALKNVEITTLTQKLKAKESCIIEIEKEI